LKRKSLGGDACPVARSLDLIGDWWSLLIIRDAFAGIRRFGDLQKNLGVAKNILTVRLKSLVSQKILRSVPASDGSIYREYVLTDKGRALMPVLIALAQWGNEYTFGPGELASVMVDARYGRPIQKVVLLSEDGSVLKPEDIVTKFPDGGDQLD
jgi:DNA-binding HxlR family transcriptional regulator